MFTIKYYCHGNDGKIKIGTVEVVDYDDKENEPVVIYEGKRMLMPLNTVYSLAFEEPQYLTVTDLEILCKMAHRCQKQSQQRFTLVLNTRRSEAYEKYIESCGDSKS